MRRLIMDLVPMVILKRSIAQSSQLKASIAWHIIRA